MDLPFLLSQSSRGRSISGEDLEAFGKKAAELWSSSDKSLNEAVVETIKHAGLTPEQVRRVIEFTNTSAYLGEFNKEGAPHRVVEFHGGPADPSAVLQDLNDGGGGSVFDRGMLDYSGPPSKTKTASARDEKSFEQMFATQAPNIPEENPLGEVVDLREKMAGLHDHLTSEISGLEVMHIDLCGQLCEQVKQAALEGYTLGAVVQVWSKVTDEPVFFKTAFDAISQRLIDNGVFKNAMAVVESLEKTGSEKMVNMNHPLLSTFQEYCEALEKLASLRVQQQDAAEALRETTEFLLHPEKTAGFPGSSSGAHQPGELKEAAGGAIGKILSGAEAAGKAVAPAAEGAAKLLVGPGSGASSFGKGVGTAVKYAPHAIGAALAARAAQHLSAAGQSPIGHTVKSFIPGTQDYQQKQYQLQMQYGGGMPYGTY
jgi:hypothetical protein